MNLSISNLITRLLNSYTKKINDFTNLKELYALVDLTHEDKEMLELEDVRNKIKSDIENLLKECNVKIIAIDEKINNLMIHFLYRYYKYNENVSNELEYIYKLKYLCSFEESPKENNDNKITSYKIRKFLKLSVIYSCVFIFEGSKGESIMEFYEDNFPKQIRYA